MGAKNLVDELDIELKEDELQFAENFLNIIHKRDDDILLGIHPGCDEGSKHKRWPIERFISVARALCERDNLKVIFFIGPSELDLLRPLSTIENKKITLGSNMSLGQTMALISKCDLFLSNDSGIMHVEFVLKIPVVALFGATSPVKNKPWKTSHTIIQHLDEKDFLGTDFIEDLESIQKISTDEVIEVFSDLLNDFHPTKKIV